MPLNLSNNISQAIPGFGGNTASASNLIKELLSGQLTTGERREIFRSGAERGLMSGMPGSTAQGGSLFANADLRNIGLASGARQQQGFDDLLSMLGVYSGTVFPTTGQELQNQQFQQDLGFRNTQANRDYGFRRNAEELAAAEFNQRYGPQLYERDSTSLTNRNLTPGSSGPDYRFYQDRMGRRSNTPEPLMFRYGRR